MKKIFLATVMTVAAAGCGDDPKAVRASGSVRMTVHQPGQSDGSTSLTFPEGTIVDSPPGMGVGFVGSCVRSANGTSWSASISRADSGTDGLRKIDVSSSFGTGAVVASLQLGQSTFGAAGACTGTSATLGSNGLSLTARCTALSSTGDLRTLDGEITLQLSNCTVR